MSLTPGSRIGEFEIVASLGAGGMGQVYRARDTKLGRDVAIKILHADFADDAGRRARFEREARTLAALNHPHIATLFRWEPVETQPGLAGDTMLVMELVDGPTLHTKLARGPLPLAEAVRIASEIADAVAAAHERGVIHRDLKPANIQLTTTGAVKVLDFGIAKSIGEVENAAVTAPLTEAGQIVGTPAYMSPEQARGQDIDARSDVWAFGCLLFEMLTGRRAFAGATRSDVVAAVLEREPDWALLPPGAPAGVRVLIRRCLQKDRHERLHAMADARMTLADLGHAWPEEPRAAPRSRAPQLAVAALAASLLTALTTWALLRTQEVPAEPAQRYEIATPAASPINLQTTTPTVALSPDGRRLSYVTDANLGSGGQLMVREVDDLTPRLVEGAPRARDHAFSPDGQWLVYLASEEDGGLRKVPVTGGAPFTLCNPPGTIRGPSWGDDGSIVFSTTDPETGLLSVSSEGGTPEVLTKPDVSSGEADHLFPSALPSGRGVLFVIHPVGLGEPELAVRDGRSGAIKRLGSGAAARYVDGRIVYAANGTLYAQPFDLDRLELTGEPVIVAERVLMGISGGAYFDVARNGTVVYVPASAASDPPRRLVWVDRFGAESAFGAPDLPYLTVRLSPGGDRVATAVSDAQRDIYTWDVVRRTLARVTTDAREEMAPVWTADGKELIYASRRTAGSLLSQQLADGSAAARHLPMSPGTTRVPTAVTNDGRYLLGNQTTLGVWELFILPLDWPDAVRTGIQTQANFPETSPNGRFLVFMSYESGLNQVYVRPFPQTEARRWQVSSAGGTHPVWRADGRELFYWQPRDARLGHEGEKGGQLMAVPVDTTGPTFEWQAPRPLFSSEPYEMGGLHPFDVSRDGQRLLLIKNLDVPRDSGGRIVVMLNGLR